MEQAKSDFKYIVRVMNTDLDGKRNIVNALRKVKGVGFSIANAACVTARIDKQRKTGELSEEEIKRLNDTLADSSKLFPAWALNRRKDAETGENKQLFTSAIDFAKDMDIRIMKKMRSYRGMRHAFGLPVRGQRTRSNFRKNKGKGLGVVKSKQIPQTPEKER
jgi:small subunit ribosomal protein S13